MIRKYLYKGKEYHSSYEVRQAVWNEDHVAFAQEPESLEDRIAFWASLGVTHSEEAEPEPTDEELHARKVMEAKRLRRAKVAAITVTVDGLTFDGNEASQSRMRNAISYLEMNGLDSINWTMQDNTVQFVKLDQMKRAYSEAVKQMTELWNAPNLI